MREHLLEVTRTARYHTLGSDVPHPREVWFVLHGYRQLAGRFLRRFRPLDDGTRLLVAPEALSRFYVDAPRDDDDPGERHGPGSRVGASWMTREARDGEIADYVAYLDRLAERVFESVARDDVRFTLLGFSQGAHTAARWATLGAWAPDRTILWGEYLPPDLDEARGAERLGATELVLVMGEDDPARSPELQDRQGRRLRAWGVGARILVHPGGHALDEGTLLGLASETAR